MLQSFLSEIREFRSLTLQYLKARKDYTLLTIAEKATAIIAAVALLLIAILVIGFVALLVSFGIAEFLKTMIPAWAAFLVAAAVILLIGLAVYCLRYKLIYNPIAKAITREMFSSNDKTSDKNE